jgi:hypothetical protein
MIMALCLLVYNLAQRQFRLALALRQDTIPNQLGKPTKFPDFALGISIFYGGSLSCFSWGYSNCQFVSSSSPYLKFLSSSLPTLLFSPCPCFLIVFDLPLRAECGMQQVHYFIIV